MEERKLRSAKKYFKHKVNIEKFKINTFERLDRNIHYNHQANMEEKRKIRYPKWILASVASVLIIGASFTFGGSNIVDAAQSLINQLFGSKEELMQAYPDESEKEISYFERHMKIAKENLTEEEFNAYSQLIKEQFEIENTLQKENRKPNSKEEKRLHQINESLSTYDSKFALVEAQQLVSFKITKPTYLPKGYKQTGEGLSLKEEDIGKEPTFNLNYSNGESVFWIQQFNMNRKSDIEKGSFIENPEIYSLDGFQIEYVSSSYNAGMRVTVPEKGCIIVMFAEVLSKEEMEKVLLSMVGN